MIAATPFARIVVGYDGSAAADTALRQAVALAEQYRGEVIVVHLSDRSAAAVLPIGTAAAAALVRSRYSARSNRSGTICSTR
jgi:nucleotide-binding universal stress UspA family protein